MITIEDQFLINKPLQEVWSFFDDFAGLANCVPTLKEFELHDGNVIEGKVGVTLGAIPITSKIHLEVTTKRAPECIQAHGLSYLGETIATQLAKDESKYQAEDTGKLYLHLDLREENAGSTRVMLCAGVEAEGRLRKMYETIMRLKVPAMKKEFKEKVSKAMATTCVDANGTSDMCAHIDEVKQLIESNVSQSSRAAAVHEARPGLLARFVTWLKGLFGPTSAEEKA